MNPMPRVRRYQLGHTRLVFLFKGILILGMSLSLTSCLAQQADLERFQKDFQAKLSKLDQEKQVLNKALKESQGVLKKQKSELKALVKARAQIKSELRSLKEESLTRLSGALETEAHRLDQVNRRADDLSEEMAVLGQLMKKQNTEQDAKLSDLGKRFDGVLVQQQSKFTEQLTGFQQSLQGFKEVLGGVDTRLQEERKRSTTAEVDLRKEFEEKQAALQAKLDSDTQTLKGYLEKDVKTSVDSVAKAVTDVNANLSSRIKSQEGVSSEMQAELTTLKTAGESRQQHVQGLTKSVGLLREVLGKSGTKLGGRLDEQGQQLEQTSAGLKQIHEQLAGLATKVSTDTEALRGYLEKDVRASLTSIVKALEAEKLHSAQEFGRMDAEFQGLKQSSGTDLEDMQKKIQGQDAHVQELGQSVKSFRDVLTTVTERLGKRSDEQLQIVGQLTARMDRLEKDQVAEGGKQIEDTQTISEHLAELTSSVQSTQQGLEQVKTALSAQLQEQMGRIDDHERRLADTGPDVGALESLQQEVQDNAAHLNQVTDSLGQLKDVFNTIGTKLGERVDSHDSQLTTLSQQVQSLTK
ncbi:MAG: hypothetical protein VST68_10055 [Nitrospirota bacterium]|nr:hypothetical protein [Nitrospirota bacterium]